MNDSKDDASPERIEEYNCRGVGSYKGLQIHATGKLHQIAIKILQSLDLERKECLDLGAGSGAYSLRLKDNGFEVESLELEPLSLRECDIIIHQVDLNSNFSKILKDKKFNVITALEVIEHLENPFHFFREVRTLLRPSTL